MSETKIGRREFLASVSVVGAASASGHVLAPVAAEAQTGSQATPAQHPAEAAGYAYLKPVEQAFVEALVDHMIPKDELTGSGTELGLATYIDRALAGSGARATVCTRMGHGSAARLTRAISFRSRRRSFIAPPSRARTRIAERRSARISTAALPSRRKHSSRISPPARSRSTAACRAARSSPCSTRMSWRACSPTRSMAGTRTRQAGR